MGITDLPTICKKKGAAAPTNLQRRCATSKVWHPTACSGELGTINPLILSLGHSLAALFFKTHTKCTRLLLV